MSSVSVHVSLDPRGFLRIVHPSGDIVEESQLRRVLALHEQLTGPRKIPVLVDARGVRAMSLPARRAAAGDEVARLTSRLVVLVGDPVSTMIGNFFVRLSRPRFPTRLFAELGAAEQWLLDEETAS